LPFAGQKLRQRARCLAPLRKIRLAIDNRCKARESDRALNTNVTARRPSDVQFRNVAHNGHPAEPRDIWQARRFIEQHLTEDISLTKVANAVRINPTHLSEKFKHVTGSKFVDYVARNRFENARKLLEDFDLRVSETAFAVGFQSLSQFNRVFKKLSGKSPTDYRGSEARRQKRH
jgi:AraC-like DNA-binding protein